MQCNAYGLKTHIRKNSFYGSASAVDLWQRLGDGYRVEAAFIIWQGEDVLQIPSSTLFRHADSWATFVVKDGDTMLKQVQVDNHNGLVAEIISGLSEGEIVITHPGDNIEDGSGVRLR